jgi:hypothetical protein
MGVVPTVTVSLPYVAPTNGSHLGGMNNTYSEYHTQIVLRGFDSAFYRDSINRSRQLHWHFAGKCEAFRFGLHASAVAIIERQDEANRAVDRHRSEKNWRYWNYFLGMSDGLAEILAIAEAVLSHAAPRAAGPGAVVGLEPRAPMSEFRKELEKTHVRAVDNQSVFRENSSLHRHFTGKENALRSAHNYSLKDLCTLFRAARESAHGQRKNARCHSYFDGVAAGLAEALALKKLARGRGYESISTRISRA